MTLKSEIDEKTVADVMIQMTLMREIDERIVADASIQRKRNRSKERRRDDSRDRDRCRPKDRRRRFSSPVEGDLLLLKGARLLDGPNAILDSFWFH